jgi:hypothetical protein
MGDVPNKLTLMHAQSPYIAIAIPDGGNLERELLTAIKIVRSEKESAASEGVSPDGRGSAQLSAELEFLRRLLTACRDVESHAAVQRGRHVEGFYELAAELGQYASLFGRNELPRRLSPVSPRVPPAAAPAAQPPPLKVGTLLTVDRRPAGQVRGVFVGYGRDIPYKDGSWDKTVTIRLPNKKEELFGFKGFGTVWFVPKVPQPPAVQYTNSQFPNISRNIKAGIARYPEWRHLHYLYDEDGKRKDANRAAAIGGHKPAKAGFQLDEFPFASTYEGGNQGGKRAEVMEVPEKENLSQGGFMNTFYQRNKLQDGDDFVVLV